MALNGEVALEIGGQTYTLKLTVNAMVELQDVTGQSFQDTLARVNGGDVKAIRDFVWASLRKHHKALTQEQVGDLIDEAGGIFGFAEQLGTLAQSATPDAEDLTALGVKPSRRPLGKRKHAAA